MNRSIHSTETLSKFSCFATTLSTAERPEMGSVGNILFPVSRNRLYYSKTVAPEIDLLRESPMFPRESFQQFYNGTLLLILKLVFRENFVMQLHEYFER